MTHTEKGAPLKSVADRTWADRSKLNWINVLFLGLIHLGGTAASIAYIYFFGLQWPLIALAILFYMISGFGITVGYHRLFSHQTFKTNPIVESLLLVAGGLAFQNSALKWCYDHRLHHKFVDSTDDPYNINRGFWYAHIGWIFYTSNPTDFPKYRKDLESNPRVIFQNKYYLPITILSSLVLPTLIGYFFNAPLGAFLIAGLLRITIVHHFTFFINSLCHVWGRQPYDRKGSAKDNGILALFTYGEGYHNFHHYFQNDYRNGILWYQYDPSKWLIRILSYLGLAHSLKTAPQLSILRAQLEIKKVELQARAICLDSRIEWSQKIEDLVRRVDVAYQNMRNKKQNYRDKCCKFHKSKSEQARKELAMLRAEFKSARIEYKMVYRQWQAYCGEMVKV